MIIPVTYKVLVKPDKVETEDPSYAHMRRIGLAIPESEQKRMDEAAMTTGVVVALGPTAFHAYMKEAYLPLGDCPVQVGDRVGFAKYAGSSKVDPDDGEKYIIMADEDINCVITKREDPNG